MAYKQKNNPFKFQGDPSVQGLSKEERIAKAQGREVGEMNKSSRFHPDNAGRGPKTAVKMKSPMKGKLKPCQKAAARKKFDVYPSAYANIWASRHKC